MNTTSEIEIRTTRTGQFEAITRRGMMVETITAGSFDTPADCVRVLHRMVQVGMLPEGAHVTGHGFDQHIFA